MSAYFRYYVKRDPHPHTQVRYRCSFHNTILDVIKARGWKEAEPDGEWDFMWCDKDWIHDEFDHLHLHPHQKVNHFRNHYELTRKDLLVKNMKRSKRALEREGRFQEAELYSVCPTTFVLPLEYSMFVEEFKRNHNSIWIMKPVGKSQGKGIFLFDRLSQISEWRNDSRWRLDNPQGPQAESYVVQKYVENPLLIGGKKFDIRLYCLVTSYSPLVAYLYRSGFARFSYTHFRLDEEHISNMCMHLTNVAVQKNSDRYDARQGGKWDFRHLKLHLSAKYGSERTNQLMQGIENIIIKSLQSVQKVMINDKHCFELYGYDVIIDRNLKPWLLEVNASPSLTANTRSDHRMKSEMLDDVLSVVDMEKYLTGTENQIGGWDILCRGTTERNPSPPNATYSSFLGCENNRKEQLSKLARRVAAGPGPPASDLPGRRDLIRQQQMGLAPRPQEAKEKEKTEEVAEDSTAGGGGIGGKRLRPKQQATADSLL